MGSVKKSPDVFMPFVSISLQFLEEQKILSRTEFVMQTLKWHSDKKIKHDGFHLGNEHFYSVHFSLFSSSCFSFLTASLAKDWPSIQN